MTIRAIYPLGNDTDVNRINAAINGGTVGVETWTALADGDKLQLKSTKSGQSGITPWTIPGGRHQQVLTQFPFVSGQPQYGSMYFGHLPVEVGHKILKRTHQLKMKTSGAAAGFSTGRRIYDGPTLGYVPGPMDYCDSISPGPLEPLAAIDPTLYDGGNLVAHVIATSIKEVMPTATPKQTYVLVPIGFATLDGTSVRGAPSAPVGAYADSLVAGGIPDGESNPMIISLRQVAAHRYSQIIGAGLDGFVAYLESLPGATAINCILSTGQIAPGSVPSPQAAIDQANMILNAWNLSPALLPNKFVAVSYVTMKYSGSAIPVNHSSDGVPMYRDNAAYSMLGKPEASDWHSHPDLFAITTNKVITIEGDVDGQGNPVTEFHGGDLMAVNGRADNDMALSPSSVTDATGAVVWNSVGGQGILFYGASGDKAFEWKNIKSSGFHTPFASFRAIFHIENSEFTKNSKLHVGALTDQTYPHLASDPYDFSDMRESWIKTCKFTDTPYPLWTLASGMEISSCTFGPFNRFGIYAESGLVPNVGPDFGDFWERGRYPTSCIIAVNCWTPGYFGRGVLVSSISPSGVPDTLDRQDYSCDLKINNNIFKNKNPDNSLGSLRADAYSNLFGLGMPAFPTAMNWAGGGVVFYTYGTAENIEVTNNHFSDLYFGGISGGVWLCPTSILNERAVQRNTVIDGNTFEDCAGCHFSAEPFGEYFMGSPRLTSGRIHNVLFSNNDIEGVKYQGAGVLGIFGEQQATITADADNISGHPGPKETDKVQIVKNDFRDSDLQPLSSFDTDPRAAAIWIRPGVTNTLIAEAWKFPTGQTTEKFVTDEGYHTRIIQERANKWCRPGIKEHLHDRRERDELEVHKEMGCPRRGDDSFKIPTRTFEVPEHD